MVWGMNMPSGFGEFWPDGQFEGNGDGVTSNWAERLRTYYLQQTPEMRRELYDGADDGSGIPSYAYYVSQKFVNEPRAVVRPDQPPLSPIRQHEPPQSFDIVRGGKSLGSLIKLNDRIVAVDAELRSLIEGLEPDTHQFFPIEIRLRNGSLYPVSYFTMVIGCYFDSFSPEDSDRDAFHKDGVRHFFNEKSKKGITGLALSKKLFGKAHLWRERSMTFRPIFFSDTLQAEISNAGLRIPKNYRAKEI